MGRIRWGRLFRRGMAVCLATIALWLLVLGAGAHAITQGMDALGGSGAFVEAVLTAELGAPSETRLPFLLALAVDQSPLFAANLNTVAPIPHLPAPSVEILPNAQPAPDHDDVADQPPETTAAPEDIVERTLVPQSDQGYVTGGGLYL